MRSMLAPCLTGLLGCLGTLLGTLTLSATASAGTLDSMVEPNTGWVVVMAAQGSTSINLVPSAGCNVSSIQYKGRELLRQPEEFSQLRGFRYGTPILYPTPNRVKDAKFTSGGQSYNFTPNNGSNFLNGLVNTAPFELGEPQIDDDKVVIPCHIDFIPGTAWYDKFPHRHRLYVTITVTDSGVRWDYKVDNTMGEKPVPYGFGLHPWFLYQGQRSETFIQIPAANLMESVELLPTGKLLTLEGNQFDARKPVSLDKFVVDNIYYGMRPELPTVVHFRDVELAYGFFASANFTHMGIYTPLEPYFCIENMTSSADAHNLANQGFAKESNLLTVEAGGTNDGWVEVRFKEAASDIDPYGQRNNVTPVE